MVTMILMAPNTDEIPITASFGVTTVAPTDNDLSDILERVDSALHDAKNCGRNTVRTKTVEPGPYLAQI